MFFMYMLTTLVGDSSINHKNDVPIIIYAFNHILSVPECGGSENVIA